MSKLVADSGGRIPYDAALRQGNEGDASMVTRLRIWVAILAAALHSEPIVLDAWQTMRSCRGSIVWKPVAAAGGS